MTCIVVTALGNQPEAFASDLGDDQSRYLLTIYGLCAVSAVAEFLVDVILQKLVIY